MGREKFEIQSQAFGEPKNLPDGGQKRSLVQEVYGQIMSQMDNGQLSPGDRVVASEIASQLGLSRAPVREALHILAGQGFVELLPDRGARLRLLSQADLAQIYEISAPTAALGLKGAAEHIHESDNAARITAAMQKIRDVAKMTPQVQFYLTLNDYHYLANAIAQKPLVSVVLRALNIEYWNRLLVEVIDLNQHAAQYVRNYERITDAIQEGDGASAEAIMHFHAKWCISLLQQQ